MQIICPKRLLIIKTNTYGLEDLIKILAIRASTENIKLTADALAHLGVIGDTTSLRYDKMNKIIHNLYLMKK